MKSTMLTMLLIVALAAGAVRAADKRYEPKWQSLDQRPTPEWFLDAKFGVFIHWGVYSVPAWGQVGQYAEWYWNNISNRKPDNVWWQFHVKNYGENFDYKEFAPRFTAELYDANQWARLFQRAGVKYVVPTSKHHEGFCLWPSAEASRTWGRPWNAVEIGPKRDLLGELAKATRAQGLKFGFYYSLYEWFNPVWKADRAKYVAEHMTPQFKDVVTRYQPAIIFSDGEWDLTSAEWKSEELLAWLFNESPCKDEVVVNDRWGKDCRHKHGGYWTTEYTPGMSGIEHTWEESRGMGFSYGYNRAERLEHYRTGRELIIMLVDLVSRGGNLLLDIGPDADGTIPVIMEERLIEIGSWLQVNGEAIYGTKPWKATRQWSAGEVPKVDYNKEYESTYDVTKQVSKPEQGKASIDAFFTIKGKELFAILPRWSGRQFVLKDVAGVKSVSLLGSPAKLTFKSVSGGVLIDLPDLPENLLPQPLWILKVIL
jgi:alpha-L-fucosidase